jgi:hypothetical protein
VGASGGAGGAASLKCVSQAAIAALQQPFSCDAKAIVKAPSAWLPHECHSQGIGYVQSSGQFVTTCQDQNAGSSGRVLAFPGRANDGAEWTATSALELFDDVQTTHPSAIQIGSDGTFLVAMAKSSANGPSVVHPLRVNAQGKLEVLGNSFNHAQSHIGAMAYAPLAGSTYAVGCGWDCATLSVYAAKGSNNLTALTLASHGSTKTYVQTGVDENVGAYNAIYLTERCEDGKPLLFASHDEWLDVWVVDKLGSNTPALTKIA